MINIAQHTIKVGGTQPSPHPSEVDKYEILLIATSIISQFFIPTKQCYKQSIKVFLSFRVIFKGRARALNFMIPEVIQ